MKPNQTAEILPQLKLKSNVFINNEIEQWRGWLSMKIQEKCQKTPTEKKKQSVGLLEYKLKAIVSVLI